MAPAVLLRAGRPTARHAVILTGLLDRIGCRGRIERTVAWFGGADVVDLYVVSEELGSSADGDVTTETAAMDAWLRSLPSFVAVEWLPHTESEFYTPVPELHNAIPGWPYGGLRPRVLGPAAQQMWKQVVGWRLMERTARAAGHAYAVVARARPDMVALTPRTVDLDAVLLPREKFLRLLPTPVLRDVHSLQWPRPNISACPQPAPFSAAAASVPPLHLVLPPVQHYDGFADQVAWGPHELMELYFLRLFAVHYAVGVCNFLADLEVVLMATLLQQLGERERGLLLHYDPAITYCLDSVNIPCGLPLLDLSQTATVKGVVDACSGPVSVPPLVASEAFAVRCSASVLAGGTHVVFGTVHSTGDPVLGYASESRTHVLYAADGPACERSEFSPTRDALATTSPTRERVAWLTAACTRAPCCVIFRCLESPGCGNATAVVEYAVGSVVESVAR